ncbi:hypothetical protein [Deinococcus sp. QL22]|nr:hypothetical protein [Deinococcus sp. QL22]UQN08660.1 hypothetical protein M1R55_21265 [Deinococcus sp. QL22]
MAVAPRDGEDVMTLQKQADVAMYRAKQVGKNNVPEPTPVAPSLVPDS